jgi:hypothetical protein
MPGWLPSLRRRPRTSLELIASLEEHFGPESVEVMKQASTAFGGLLAMVRTGTTRLPRRGNIKLLQAYAEMPWVRAVVGKIAESIAATEWLLFRSTSTDPRVRAALAMVYAKAGPARRKRLRKQMELVELAGHPLLDLLESGNDFHTGQTIDELTQAQLELVGEGFWLKERDGMNNVVELWNLPPSWVVSTPHPGEEKREFLVRVAGVDTPIPMEEIIWFKKADPYLPYDRGVGTGRSLGDELDTDEYAAKHQKAWFVNGAIPDLLVSADGLQPSDTERLEEDWLDKNQGWWRKFKPYFVGKKLTVTKLTSSFREMGLGQLRKDQRDVIIHTWGVAPEMFGITENSNRANITGAFYQYARWVLVPRLEFKRIFLQTRLVPDFDPGLILDYESPVEDDKAHVLETMQAAPWAFTVDQWLEQAGKEELPDGKGQVYGVPFNLLFVKDHSEAGSLSPAPAPAPEPPPDDDEPPEPPDDEDEGPEVPAIAAHVPSAVKVLTPEQEAVIGQTLEAVESAKIDAAVRPVLQEVVIGFGSRTMNDVLPGIAYDITDPAVTDYLLHGRAAEIRGANATTREAIRRTLAEGYEAGESVGQLQRRIEAEFADAIGWRSNTIARTETVSPANFGILNAMEQANIPFKAWLAVRDDVTREAHLILDALPPIPITEDFYSPISGGTAAHPGEFGIAGEDINCRCAVEAVAEPPEGEEPRSILDTEEKRAAAWKTFEAERIPYERAMASALRSAFADQQAAALAAFKE